MVLAYLAAVSQRDWPRVWRLGGKNLGTIDQQKSRMELRAAELEIVFGR